MAEKRAARRAAAEPFVHRIDPSGGGGLRTSLTVAAIAYTPTLLVLLVGAAAEIFGSFFANHWPTVAIVGSLNTVVVLVIKAATTAAKNEADSEGIALILDANGVYLGGRQPRRIPWRDISAVRLTTVTRHAPNVKITVLDQRR